MTVVAAVTGAGGVRGGGCPASLAVCSVLLLATAILLAVVRPHAMPSENVLNPVKFALLAATSLTLLLLDGEHEGTALAALSALQTVVTALRMSVKLYVKVENWWWMNRNKSTLNQTEDNEDGSQSSAPQLQDVVQQDATAPVEVDLSPPPPLRPRSPSPSVPISANGVGEEGGGAVDPTSARSPSTTASAAVLAENLLQRNEDNREEDVNLLHNEEEKEGEEDAMSDAFLLSPLLKGTSLATAMDHDGDCDEGGSLLLRGGGGGGANSENMLLAYYYSSLTAAEELRTTR